MANDGDDEGEVVAEGVGEDDGEGDEERVND